MERNRKIKSTLTCRVDSGDVSVWSSAGYEIYGNPFLDAYGHACIMMVEYEPKEIMKGPPYRFIFDPEKFRLVKDSLGEPMMAASDYLDLKEQITGVLDENICSIHWCSKRVANEIISLIDNRV